MAAPAENWQMRVVQMNRKAGMGPHAACRYVYIPPLSGIIVP